jgi:PIN domain nuclease of toxin-antitoxin system
VRILLDTCTFLWIAADSPELSTTARKLFADPANEVFLSAVAAWEIMVKHALGRLPLPEPPERFIPMHRDLHQIAPLPLAEAAVMQLAKLPDYHRDPFDRMLVCQAIADGLALLTPDELIAQYPVRTVW